MLSAVLRTGRAASNRVDHLAGTRYSGSHAQSTETIRETPIRSAPRGKPHSRYPWPESYGRC